MTEFYDDLADTAAELLAEFGQAVTLTHVAAGAYNTATGVTAAATTTTQTGVAVEDEYSAHSIDGTLIKAGDKKLYLSPLDSAGAQITAPVAEDTAELAAGGPWTIKKVTPVQPGGTPVLYVLQVRK